MITLSDLNDKLTQFHKLNKRKATKIIAGAEFKREVEKWSYLPHWTKIATNEDMEKYYEMVDAAADIKCEYFFNLKLEDHPTSDYFEVG